VEKRGEKYKNEIGKWKQEKKTEDAKRRSVEGEDKED
jgi:hypothetical protein